MVPSEGEAFALECHANAAGVHIGEEGTQVVHVAGQTVYAVDDGVTVADEAQQFLEVGAVGVLTAGVIFKDPVEFEAVELTGGVLVEGADPNVADALSCTHGCPPVSG